MKIRTLLMSLIMCALLISIISHEMTSMKPYARLSMSVEIPPLVGSGETFTCRITFPKGYDVYYYTLIIFGYNLTNGGPVNTISGSSNTTNVFFVNITAPEYSPQSLGIQIEGRAKLYDKWAIATKTVYVKVVKTLKFTVTVECSENFDAANVTINFYIDGRYIGNTTILSLQRGKNSTVTYRWVPKDLKEGWHRLTVRIVGKGVVFSETKSTVYELDFYYGKYTHFDIGPILFATFTLMSFIILFLTFREIGRRRKPKWEK